MKLLDYVFFEKKIHKFDTATCYGRSEQIFGQWVSSRKIDRNSFYIICKGGHHSYENNKLVNRINLQDILYDIKSSFNKLKIEFADCFMFHRDDENIDPETIYTICKELLNKNLCKNIGVSNWNTSRIQSVNEISIKRTGKTIINSSQIFMNYITLIKEPYANIHKINYEDYLWYQENKNHEVSVYSPVCFINSDSNIHKNIIFKNILEFLSVKFNESKEKILYVLIENIYNLNVKCITGSLTPSHIYEQSDLKKIFNLINGSYPNLTEILSVFLFDTPTNEPTNNIKSFIQNGFVGPFKMKNYENNNVIDEIKDYILNINKGDYNLLKNHHETNTIIRNLVNNKILHDIVNEYIGYECACWNTEFFIRDNNDDFKYTSNWHIDTYFDINEKYPHFTIQIGLTDNDINNSLKCIRGSHLNDYQQNYNKQNISGFAPLMLYDDSKINTDLIYNLLSTKGNIYLFSNYLTHGKGIIMNNSSVRVGLTLRLISKQAVVNRASSHVSKKIFYLGSKINNDTSENKTHNLIWQSVHNCFLNYCDKYKEVKIDLNQSYYEDSEVNIFETRNDMLKHYCSEIKTPKILEIGVFKGEFLDYIVENCDYNHIDAVDLFEGVTCSGNCDGNNVVYADVGKEYVKLIEKYKNYNNITINKASSVDFLKLQNDNTYDIIYIDGDHSYEGVKKDLEQSYRKIKNGRYIMGHDYEMNMEKAKNYYNFGVKKAVDEFCKKYSLSIISKGNDGCVSYCIKVIKDNQDKNNPSSLINKYVWENSNIEFLENGKMNAFGQGKYEFIDKYLVKCDFGGKEHLLKFNGNYSRFFSVRKDDFEVVLGDHL